MNTNNYALLLLFMIGCFFFAQEEVDSTQIETKKEEVELDELEVKSQKKAVERKADRVIFDFSEQPHLNAGSLKEGLQKLPGLIISEVVGMMYQGKELEVYLDGRPLNIFSDELFTYLEGIPANSIERVEIITQPGAEFPATSGGAIINIITANNAKSYLSATYSNGFSFTDYYGKSRVRFNNSLNLNAKNKWFAWQIQAGQSYRETLNNTILENPNILFSNNISDNIGRNYFINSGLKFSINKDKLLVNYNFSNSINNADLDAFGDIPGTTNQFVQADFSKTKNFRHDVAFNYKKRFKKTDRKLDLLVNYVNNTNDFNQNVRSNLASVLNNGSNRDYYQIRLDYSQGINILDKAKFSVGTAFDFIDFQSENEDILNLDFNQDTRAVYAEFTTEYGKFDFIIGGRLESYDLSGITRAIGSTDFVDLNPFETTRFFPNFTTQYNLTNDIFINLNYNKKINIPTTSQLNPNNTNYQNENINFGGNAFLEPTIFDNYSVNLSAYEYFYFNYSVSRVDDEIATQLNAPNNTLAITPVNIPESTVHSINFGIPIPYMLFTQGLQKTLEFDFNPDEINFLYLDFSYQNFDIPGIDAKGVWNFFALSQIILPKNINFTANYSTSTTGGNYNFFIVNQPFNHRLDFNFSKKFLNDDLSLSVYLNDVLNTNRDEFLAINTDITYNRKVDSRRVGFSLTYKIPTKNKSDEEETIIDSKKGDDEDSKAL